MSGRPRKPTALHKLEGTYRASVRKRRALEPQPQGDLAVPPEWLTPGQRESWDYAIANAPKGLLKRLDRGVLELWVTAEDRFRTAETMLRLFNEEPGRLPYLMLTPHGWRPSPYLDIARDAARQMLQASDRLGFSPAARPRIQMDPPKPDQPPTNAWGALRRFPVIDGGKAR